MYSDWLKKFIKATIPPLVDAAGIYTRTINDAARASPVWLVVMYHRVIREAGEDPFHLGMCVTESRFREQIEYLQNNFEPISLREGARRMQDGRPMPTRSVSFTFDDGYADNATVAWPILRSHGLPSTIYVTVGGRDEGRALWWDRVIHAIANTTQPILFASEIGLKLGQESFPLSWASRSRSLTVLLDRLWQLDMTTVLKVVDRIEETLSPRPNPRTLPARLSDEAIIALHEAGVEIGAHTVTHPNLCMLSGPGIKHELMESKKTLERLTGATIDGFAYPAGFCNDRVIQAVAEAGYRYAVGTERGLNRGNRNPFLIERMGAPNTGMADFKRCVASLTRASSQGHD